MKTKIDINVDFNIIKNITYIIEYLANMDIDKRIQGLIHKDSLYKPIKDIVAMSDYYMIYFNEDDKLFDSVKLKHVDNVKDNTVKSIIINDRLELNFNDLPDNVKNAYTNLFVGLNVIKLSIYIYTPASFINQMLYKTEKIKSLKNKLSSISKELDDEIAKLKAEIIKIDDARDEFKESIKFN